MKQIALDVAGVFATVSDEDFEWLSQWEWRLVKSVRNHSGYAARPVKGGTVYMHREVMKAVTGTWVDHRDANGLNNQRSNLRLATPAQNCHHTFKVPGRTSNFKGVYKNAPKYKRSGWGTTLTVAGKSISLGSYINERTAAVMYDFWKTFVEPEFAYTNFTVVSQWTNPNA